MTGNNRLQDGDIFLAKMFLDGDEFRLHRRSKSFLVISWGDHLVEYNAKELQFDVHFCGGIKSLLRKLRSLNQPS